jgi:phenylpyruvate tautomerase PptA (4-oxalocrotonate tautomerase family)
VPHLTMYALESDLTGAEPDLIAALTDAVVAVYGGWARESVVVLLIGLPANRCGVGGKVAASPAPHVTFGIRATVFDRPDASDVLSRLAAGVTDAIATVLGEQLRPGVTVQFAGEPEGHTAVGGTLVTH